LERRKQDIYQIATRAPFRLIELGVGDARKTKVLLNHFLEQGLQFEYVIVDFCQERIEQTVASLQKEYNRPGLTVLGIVADYSTALVRLKGENNLRNIVLFLGSSIGNFEFRQMRDFLQEMWNAINDGDCVLIGFDLKKDIHILQSAYNDKAGITREFNLNLLDRLNRDLEADFDRNKFLHHSFYNPAHGRMESWVISNQKQTITFAKLQKAFEFDTWEGIHVENSYKYDLKEIGKLAETVGFSLDGKFIDSKGYFADVIWEVKKLS
jgi:L-histidine N-alpha-methyltransferase